MRDTGVGRGTRVAVCLDHRPHTVVALLAVLKAGGAFVPLDPAYPAARKEFVLADTAAPVVVSSDDLADRIPAGDAVLISVDDATEAGSAPLPEVSADDPAYVIYTSGSTGEPKGVVLRHGGAVNYLRWCADAYPAHPGVTGTFLYSALTFDLTITALFLPLVQGSSITIPVVPPGGNPFQSTVEALVEGAAASFLKATPSHLELLVAQAEQAGRRLRVHTHVVGGEELTGALTARLLAVSDVPTTVVNEYGPTEATVGCANHRIDADTRFEPGGLPIGTPIANTEMYVVDADDRLVPDGTPGELLIGGVGVAAGYLNRPELTAERFVDNPFGPGRLYRSGDLAIRRPDGLFGFLGRIDDQIKLRGHRIEPGEIEAALLTHPAVTSATVTVREDVPGDRRLTAYLVAPAGFDTSGLRAALAATLPSHMLPAAFVVVDAIPLNANGKVDRDALPAPTADAGATTPGTVSDDPIEAGIAEIWRQVLGVAEVGVHDDFFELGGHSLLATRVVSRIRDEFGVEVPIGALFTSPTVARLAGLVSAAGDSEGGRIPTVPRDGGLPLSFAQQRLWFLDQLEPGGREYLIPFAFRVSGDFDVAAMESAVSALTARHEVLRTRYVAGDDGDPLQVVDPATQVTAAHIDAPDAAADTDTDRRHITELLAGQPPFDLAADRLLRLTVLRYSDTEHLVLIVMHHIVSDGWSAGILAAELGELYRAAVTGTAPHLPVLPVQYGDYAVWQRARLTDDVVGRQLEYWTERLAGLEPLELPTDRSRPPVRSGRGGAVRVTLPPEVVAGLRRTGARRGASLFMTGLAVFQLLMSRYTRQTDIAVGTPIAGRNHTDVENLIGFFVNTLVMRTDLSDDPTVGQLIDRVREHALAAYRHQDVPFEQVVAALAPERDRSRNPLAQVVFAFQNTEQPTLRRIPGATVSPSPVGNEHTKFDLTVFATERDGGLEVEFVYAADLFDESTVERMAGHFARLAAGVAHGDETPTAELDMTSPSERRRLLAWSGTHTDFPADAVVDELVARRAATRPDAVALVDGDVTWTYRDLDTRANRLAHLLRRAGCGHETPVGVQLPPGGDLVVTVLAILKAGGAYVPLDMGYPPARLEFMIRDTGAPLVVTGTAAPVSGLSDIPARLLSWEAVEAELAAQPETPPDRVTTAESLAYVIYTSGSTGTPKGVQVTHRNINRLTHGDYAPLAPGDTVAQISNTAFDAFTWECWATLTHGATLAILPRETVLSAAALATELRRRRVTALFMTAALFHQHLLERPDLFDGVRTVMFGGETVERSVVDRLVAREHGPGAVVNGYGPTETTTFALTHTVVPGRHADARTIPIGRPIADTDVYIVDATGRPVPVGVPGELWIGGAGVARGYHGRPELTAERFVDSPFGRGRVYRTGDLVKWLPDGHVEFLGRIDGQVKLRGHRIEPGEIEAAILRDRGVSACTVVVREDTPGDRRLVAYLVSDEGVDTAVLRDALRARIPEYMVPGAFVTVPAIPLTPNGKVDRRALPAPPARHEAADGFVAPRTPTEEAVAAAWRDVLHVTDVGVHDDFFASGGHSLSATRLVSRLNRDLAAGMTVAEVFAAPTVAGLAAAVDGRAGMNERTNGGIPVSPRHDAMPLSFAQQRLWFLDQLEPDDAEYLVPFGMRVSGVLDVAALEKAVTALVARHEVLRTRFAADANGDPVQVIDPPTPVTAVRVTARDADHALDILTDHSHRPFDLSADPMLRLTVVQSSETEYLVLIVMHHIAADGWSAGVLATELGRLYAAGTTGARPDLPTLPVQYADFAAWQRDHLTGDLLDRQLSYWTERLRGLEPLELPTDRPRPVVRSGNGDAVSFRLPHSTVEGLRRLTATHGTSLFMTTLAAFQLLLARYTRQTDIAVGTPMAGRNHADVEELVGFFVNTLVMRTDLSDRLTVAGLLEQVRRHALDAHTHQDLPFERLVDELAPRRDPSRNPLVQVLFALQNVADLENWSLPGLDVEAIPTLNHRTRFDLTMTMAEQDDGTVVGDLVYATDLFDRSTVERMAGHYVNLVASMVRDVDAHVDDLDMLSKTERRLVRTVWNDTGLAIPEDATVDGLVTARAAAAPAAVAVVDGDRRVTYGELETRANRLAHLLRDHGAGPETLVGVCLDRSADMVVSLLAILKAGAAYLPLDRDYPAARIEFMVADTAAPLVITDTALASRLPDTAARLLLLDTLGDELAEHPETPPDTMSTTDGLAYVIYTSGSTGTPKGVQVTHRNINRLVHNRYADVTASDVVAQVSNCSFDAYTFECWGALVNGATMAVIGKDTTLHAPALRGALERHGVSTMFLTSALFHQHLLEDPAIFSGLKTVLYGGEAIDRSTADRLVSGDDGPSVLMHVYGPTETTTFATAHRVTRDRHTATPTLPIGAPIANTTAHVVDAAFRPVGIGVPGELLIGGPGVARGYHGRPELTAEKFVDDPFGDGRVYRTGDLVKWLPDGQIEFLGRIDKQVKLRGFRIELGEVETAILTDPTVDTCTVVLREDTPGDKRLVAYLVSDRDVDTAALRVALKDRLPEYMIPSALVTLPALPLNANGKIDTAALPAADPDRPDPSVAYVEPDGPTENTVAAIWREVLRADRIGAHDDFFALGGHSLSATRVTSRLRTGHGVDLPVRTLFTSPTLREFAAAVDAADSVVAARIRRTGRDTPPPASFAQQRLWFLDQLGAGGGDWLVPFAMRVTGPLDVGALEAAVTELVTRHEILRTRFVADDRGEPVQIIDPPAQVVAETTDVSGLPADVAAEAARRAVDECAARPFDLAADRLLRLAVARVTRDEHLVLIVMHHIVSDGWSAGILADELDRCYAAALDGRPVSLPPLRVQYADFAAWQRRRRDGDDAARREEYWTRRLADLEPLELPTDRARPAERSGRGDAVTFSLPATTVAGLRRMAGEYRASLFMTALAAFQLLLSHYSGQTDVAVGTPIAGRNHADVERLVGIFINTLVMRGDLAGDPTVGELVTATRDAALDAYAHQDMPFERLVDRLAPDRDLSRNPLVQVLFAVQNVANLENWRLRGTTVTALPPTVTTAKLDMSVFLTERDDGSASGTIVYATDLFDRSTVESFATRYRALAASLAEAGPETPVSRLALTEDSERPLVPADAGTGADHPGTHTLHRLVEETAVVHPDRIAVRCGGVSLTYAELDRDANRLAHLLRERGARPGRLVGVCLERGVEVITAILGVLKSGAAYLPLDPDYPDARLAFMVSDASPSLLVTTSGIVERFAGVVPTVTLDGDAAEIATRPATALDTAVGPHDLAYVVYTSGSTGTPKGVLIEHLGVVNHIAHLRDHVLSDRRPEVVLQAVSPAYDASVREIFYPLSVGATVQVVPTGMADVAEYVAALDRYGVRVVVSCVPSVLGEILRTAQGAGVGLALETVLLSGESPTVLTGRADAVRAAVTEVVNQYGPTETTLTTVYRRDHHIEDGNRIGRPLANTSAYVVDRFGNPLPAGVPGELLIGGAGVARGYLNRPELTAERFVPNPFGPGRLYRTGDRARWLPDGELEFLGRFDDQVKLRGKRVEPGEIETVMHDHPAVARSVVVVREDTPGDQRLVAYVVPAPGGDLTGLRGFLSGRLPEYLVPNVFVELAELPTTVSRKVDRAALPAPAYRPTDGGRRTPPSSPAERMIAGIWRQVLEVDDVGVHDDFFALGGHSLSATRVVSRLRQDLGVAVPVRTLFAAPTVAELAKAVAELLLAQVSERFARH
ncbi:hypothetical protein GCM10023223_10040 [Stackebrandtia albiflava]